MTFTAAVRDAMLELIDEGGTHAAAYASLHTADPGTTGASEVVGGSYARQAVTWGDAASGEKHASVELVWNIPPGTTITHVGLQSASAAGTFRGGGELVDGNGDPAPQEYPTGGTFTMAVGDLTAAIA